MNIYNHTPFDAAAPAAGLEYIKPHGRHAYWCNSTKAPTFTATPTHKNGFVNFSAYTVEVKTPDGVVTVPPAGNLPGREEGHLFMADSVRVRREPVTTAAGVVNCTGYPLTVHHPDGDVYIPDSLRAVGWDGQSTAPCRAPTGFYNFTPYPLTVHHPDGDIRYEPEPRPDAAHAPTLPTYQLVLAEAVRHGWLLRLAVGETKFVPGGSSQSPLGRAASRFKLTHNVQIKCTKVEGGMTVQRLA